MKSRRIIAIIICLLLLIACSFNWKYEVVAFHPFGGNDQQGDLKVMTWNVHCSKGADIIRQKKIAELILGVDADFVLLNEYNQGNNQVTDSLLKKKYSFTEECQSHKYCGDIFYSKRMMPKSGNVFTSSCIVKDIQAITATIAVSGDMVQIIGVHLASNRYDIDTIDSKIDFKNVQPLTYQQYKEAQTVRCLQSFWIKEAVLESKHPIIVMGDMNDFSCSAPLDTFATCGLMDAWWEGGFGYGATFHNGWLRLRIDHILHSKKLNLESIKVIETNLSDHNPVVAGFSLNTNTNRTN